MGPRSRGVADSQHLCFRGRPENSVSVFPCDNPFRFVDCIFFVFLTIQILVGR